MTDRRRILFPFVGDSLGGSYLSSLTLIEHLDRSRFEPIILLFQNGPLALELDRRGLAYQTLNLVAAGREPKKWLQLLALIRATSSLWPWLKQNQIDLVHANDARMIITFSWACWLARVPMIAHQRTVASQSQLLSWSWHLSRAVIAISQFTKQSLPIAIQQKTAVVSNPVALEPDPKLTAQCRAEIFKKAEIEATENYRIVGAFGNLIAVKQPIYLAQAMAQLAGSHRIVLAIFGEDRGHYLPKMAEILAGTKWVSMGFQSPVENWMAAVDLVVAPSNNDAFGRSLVEAMSLGVPIVATACGGHLEIAEDQKNALLVSGDDPEEMARAAGQILSDPDLAGRLIEAGKERAEDFGGANHAKKVMSMYQQLLPCEGAIVIADLGGGGAQRVALDLAQTWSEEGKNIALITLADRHSDRMSAPLMVRREALGLTGESQNPINAAWFLLKRVWALRSAYKRTKVQYVISFVGATNVLAILARLGLGLHLVISERNDPAHQNLGFPWDVLRQKLYRYADWVTANSTTALQSLSAYVGKTKLRLIDNQLSGLVMAAMAQPVATREKVLLAVGRFNRQKGYDVLLPAFAASKARQHGWRLVILGEGSLAGEIKDLALALNLQESIEFAGHVHEPFNWMKRAGIFVMASRFEGTPNAVLEAAALSCPVIITKGCGGALEIIEDGRSGLVVPVEDVDALRMAMDVLAFDETRRQMMAEEAKSRVLERHHPQQVARLWRELLPA